MSKINFIAEYLSDESLDKIAGLISDVEKKTSGEIRLCIKKKRGFFEKKHTPREIALKEFTKLGMHKTGEKTGVLMFIIFNERKFEIVADEGINSKISDDHWSLISEKIKNHFVNKDFFEGIKTGILDISQTLIQEFPLKDDDRDELPNTVIVKP
ncbi:MAG: TPM domain-containing protein [bacterium]|nr:TPM domain-containing protein [bacterium]